MKEKLKETQPIAYQILENALLGKTSAHAYLFCGDKGTGKLDAAYLFAQSMVCENEGFACETCDTCQRIRENNFSDLIVIDGSEKTIKKEDIQHIQEEFNKTAFEAYGKKIYILNLVENATADAMNSLLKFLEEPASDVLAILICEQIDRVLATIVSRCQKIPFRRANVAACLKYAQEAGMDELDAYICSHFVSNCHEVVMLSEDENYQCARIWALDVIEHFYDDPYMTILRLQLEGFNEKKGNDRNQFMYFSMILMLFFKNCITQTTLCQHHGWNAWMKKYSKEESIAYLSICMNSRNQLSKSVNVKLLVDSMLIKMKEAADGK